MSSVDCVMPQRPRRKILPSQRHSVAECLLVGSRASNFDDVAEFSERRQVEANLRNSMALPDHRFTTMTGIADLRVGVRS